MFGTLQRNQYEGLTDMTRPLGQHVYGVVWIPPETYHFTICVLFLFRGIADLMNEKSGSSGSTLHGKFRIPSQPSKEAKTTFDISGKVNTEGTTDTRGGMMLVFTMPMLVQIFAWTFNQFSDELKMKGVALPEWNTYQKICTYLLFSYWARRWLEVLALHSFSKDMDLQNVQWMSARFVLAVSFLNFYIMNTNFKDRDWYQ
eukprot:SAG31_NODE_2781_length_5095_cov_9.452162_5_plen_201_part_00